MLVRRSVIGLRPLQGGALSRVPRSSCGAAPHPPNDFGLNRAETLALGYLEKRLGFTHATADARTYIQGVNRLIRSGEWMRDIKHDTTTWLTKAPSKTVVNLLKKHPDPSVRAYFQNIDVYHIPYAKLFKAGEPLNWEMISSIALEVLEFAALSYLATKPESQTKVPAAHEETKKLLSEEDFIAAMDAMIPEVFARTPLTELFINARIRYGAICPVQTIRKVTAAGFSSGEIILRALQTHPSPRVREHFKKLRLYHVAGGEQKRVYKDLPRDMAQAALLSLGQLSYSKLDRAARYMSGMHDSPGIGGAKRYLRSIDLGFGYRIVDPHMDVVTMFYSATVDVLSEHAQSGKRVIDFPKPYKAFGHASIRKWFLELRKGLMEIPEVAAVDVQRTTRSIWWSILDLHRKRARHPSIPPGPQSEGEPEGALSKKLFECDDQEYRRIRHQVVCGLQVADHDGSLLAACVEDFFRQDKAYWASLYKTPQRGFELRAKQRAMEKKVGDLTARFAPMIDRTVDDLVQRYGWEEYRPILRSIGKRAVGTAIRVLNVEEQSDFNAALYRHLYRAMTVVGFRVSVGLEVSEQSIEPPSANLEGAMTAGRAMSSIFALRSDATIVWQMVLQHLRQNQHMRYLLNAIDELPDIAQPIEEALKHQAADVAAGLGIRNASELKPKLMVYLTVGDAEWPLAQHRIACLLERLDLRHFILNHVIATTPNLDPRVSVMHHRYEAQYNHALVEQGGLVGFIFKKFAGHIPDGMDAEDVIEAGNIALDRALRGFDVFSGNRFSTYATQAIRRGMAKVIADYRAQHKHTTLDESFMGATESDAQDAESYRARFWSFLERHASMFSEREHEILCLRFGKGLTYEQIAPAYDCSRTTIGNIILNAVNLVKQYLERHPEERDG